MMNFKGEYTDEKPEVVKELESMLKIEFYLHKQTGSLYGDYKGKKIRLSDHPSKFVENGKGDFDFNYNYFNSSMIFSRIKGFNRFEDFLKGEYIQHSREERVGRCYFREYNEIKGYVEVSLEDGEIKKYDENMFKF